MIGRGPGPRPRTPTTDPDPGPRPRTPTPDPDPGPRPRTPTPDPDPGPRYRGWGKTPPRNSPRWYLTQKPRPGFKIVEINTLKTGVGWGPDPGPRPRTPTTDPDPGPRYRGWGKTPPRNSPRWYLTQKPRPGFKIVEINTLKTGVGWGPDPGFAPTRYRGWAKTPPRNSPRWYLTQKTPPRF